MMASTADNALGITVYAQLMDKGAYCTLCCLFQRKSGNLPSGKSLFETKRSLLGWEKLEQEGQKRKGHH